MLQERAAELEIDGRSKMSEDELLEAIKRATDGHGRAKSSRAGLEATRREELYKRAQDAEIDGRSSMSKDELIEALAKD